MTVSSTTNRVAYAGSGTANPLAVAFPFQSAADLRVIATVVATGVQTTKMLTTDYTVTGTPDANGNYPNGGSVVPTAVIPAGTNWTIIRSPVITQEVDIVDNDPLPARSISGPVDKLTMIAQRLADRADRALHTPDGDAAVDLVIPSSVSRASKFLAFDASGLPVATDLSGIATIIAATSQEVFASKSASLAAADSAAVILGGDAVLDTNATLAADTVLAAKRIRNGGGKITRGTHTLSGNFEAVNRAIFDAEGASSGVVTFPRVPMFFLPTMWGAANDGVTDDGYAIQAAITAAKNHGGTVILRGSYYTTRQIVADTLSTQVINYAIDGYGGRISTSGAISGLQVSGFNNTQGPRIRGLTIDHFNGNATLATAGFDCKGAIGAVLEDCAVVASDIALGSNRSNYYAYRIRATGAFGSYWCTLKDCVNRVPDSTGAGHYIKAGLLIEDDSNNAKIIRFRANEVESGIRIVAGDSAAAAGSGQANSLVVEDLAAEGFSNAALYVLHTSANASDKYLYGLKVDGIRSEPSNAGTYAFKVETTGGGAWTDSARTPRLRNLEDVGGSRILVPGGMSYVET